MGLLALRRRGPRLPTRPGPNPERATWRMPPLELLPRPVWSAARRVGMLALRGYLLVAVLLLVVKVVQLAGTR